MIIIMINEVILGSTFNVYPSNFTVFYTKVQPVQKSRQTLKFTASGKIRGFREFRKFVIFV